MDSGLDAKHFIHLPAWAKWLVLGTLGLGVAASLGVVFRFFGRAGSQDWLLLGISAAQFLIAAFVVAVVLFLSQTDANIGALDDRAAQFLGQILTDALRRVTLADDETPLTVVQGSRRDVFGYDYRLEKKGRVLMRLWCGVNVGRLIVIYRFVNPDPETLADAFVDELRRVFRFSLGGAESVGYKVTFEPPADAPGTVSVWLTAETQPDFLTDPAAKLFWSQDIAMMTESLLRTGLRHTDTVRFDVDRVPLPL